MRCLSLWQPWASLIADGVKRIETRDWPIRFRGPLAIHAAKGNLDKDFAFRLGYGHNGNRCPLGAVVCIVRIENCVQFPHPSAPPDPYGNFEDGRYGFIFTMLKKFDEPIPAKGNRLIWNWDYKGTRIEADIDKLIVRETGIAMLKRDGFL